MAYNNLGVVFEKRGELDRAAEHFEDALRIAPGYSDAHNNLGVVFARRGELDRAAEHLERAVRIAPGYANAPLHASTSMTPPPDSGSCFAIKLRI